MTLELSFESLRPCSDPRELGRAARDARLAGGLASGAVMAAERRVPMQREGHVAVRAAAGVAAGATVQRWRDAAAVEQQDRLPASLCEPAQLGEEWRRKRIARLVAEVDDAHRGHRCRNPAAELEPLERVPGLRARGRRAEDRNRALEGGALGGDGPRVVARIRLLFVGGVVLLVDADHAERGERRE